MAESDAFFEEGLLARLLSLLEAIPLSRDVLSEQANRVFDDVHLTLSLLVHAEREGYLVYHGVTCRLTEVGRNWLDEHQDILAEPESEIAADEDERDRPIPYDVSKLKMEPRFLSVFQAIRKIDKGEIVLNPEFQRAFVWNNDKKSRLIESILIRIPLPAFYLDATSPTRWIVVDGLQRLSTLRDFCANKFTLSGMQFLTELGGNTFQELPDNYRVLIEDDTNLQFYNLMPETPAAAKYTIFSRVNTGGMVLTAQEIRHALTQGSGTAWLKDLVGSKDCEFQKATAGSVASLRQADREMAVRALAFRLLGRDAFKKIRTFDEFLLKTMHHLNTLSEQALQQLKKEFNEALGKVTLVFGKYAFRKQFHLKGRRYPINKALFEVWVNCVWDIPRLEIAKHKTKICELFVALMGRDDSFIASITSSTNSLFNVEKRFSSIENLLKEAIS